MKMIKLYILIGLVSSFATHSNAALTLNWSYGGNLALAVPSVQSGWAVQLFQDVNADTLLSSITSFDASELPLGGGANAGDDQILAGFSVAVGVAKGSYSFLTSISADAIALSRVYSVLFNNNDRTVATQAWIIDTTPRTLLGAGIDAYTPNAVASTVGYGGASGIVVVPEPTSIALVGIGLAVIGLRRRFVK